jgi:hypothetical protein
MNNPVVLPAGTPGPNGCTYQYPIRADAFDLIFGLTASPNPAHRPSDPRDRAEVLAYWQARGITPAWAEADLTPVERLTRKLAAAETRIEQLTADVAELAAAVVRMEGYRLAA